MLTTSEDWRDVHHTASDGTKLYARDYGPERLQPTPVLCLSGLTRTSREFHVLASHIGRGSHLSRGRRVICPDYRGRGRSGFASDPSTYTPFVEMNDAIGLLNKLGIGKFVVIGSSRGGLIAMLMAAMQRPRLAGVVLNDIGPKIEADGLMRILPLVGQTARFASWDAAIAGLKKVNVGFDGMSKEEWDYFARFTFIERDGEIISDHDPKLAETLPGERQIVSGELPEYWSTITAMTGLPLGILRGENSDFLSEETAHKMGGSSWMRKVSAIPNRGHTPFMTEPEAVGRIENILQQVDGDKRVVL